MLLELTCLHYQSNYSNDCSPIKHHIILFISTCIYKSKSSLKLIAIPFSCFHYQFKAIKLAGMYSVHVYNDIYSAL